MKVQIKVITLIANEQMVAEALKLGGYPVVERSLYKPLKGVCFLVEHPELPFELDQSELKSSVLRWLYHRLGHELFFVVMGA